MTKISRRELVQGAAAAAVVLGFDPSARSWVTEANACSWVPLPALDGALKTDAAALAGAADDWGHIIHRTPVAVLTPGSVSDIAKMVVFARAYGIRIAPRGKGHTAFGQSQSDAGVVIDMSSLAEVHSISSDRADVDAGITWRDLLLATLPLGLTPPVLNDYTGLSVGGTLSVGGVGVRSLEFGAQVDNVFELTVVTGEGKVRTCSMTHRKKLFQACLAGLGQCAIIVRATVRLIPAEERARTLRLIYPDLPTLLNDLRVVAMDERFDAVQGDAVLTPNGFVYFIDGTTFYTGTPDDTGLTDGLQNIPFATEVHDVEYFAYCDGVYQLIGQLGAAGLNALPHPWLDVFVPDSGLDTVVTDAFAGFNPGDFLPGSIILFFPFFRSRMKQPLLRVPDEELFFLFDILRTVTPDRVPVMLDENRALFEAARDLGGKHYTISAVQLSKHDWKKHFQPRWGDVVSAKNEFDPDNVLGAGLDIF